MQCHYFFIFFYFLVSINSFLMNFNCVIFEICKLFLHIFMAIFLGLKIVALVITN